MTPAAFELRIQEDPHHFVGLFRFGVAFTEGQHVGVVMLAGQTDLFRVGRQCSADALDLVRRHGHAHASHAHQNAAVRFAFRNLVRHFGGVVGVIGRGRVVSSQILDVVAFGGQYAFKMLFQLEAGVVSTNSDSHRIFKFNMQAGPVHVLN